MNDDKVDEAVRLLEEAFAASRSDSARARLLVQKSAALELKGDPARAVEALREAAPLIDGARDRRLLWVQQFNLAVCLCDLERYEEVREVLPGVRALALELGNELDTTRVLFLDGRLSAGFGRLEEAQAAFEQVRRDFEDQEVAYDYALVSLELAVIHLEQGRTGEVKILADEMWRIFRSQELHKEALAALKLFFDAAKKERVDAGWVRRLINYLRRARGNPNLRFEP